MVGKSRIFNRYVLYQDSSPDTPLKPELTGILEREMAKSVLRDSTPRLRKESQFHQVTDNLFRHCRQQFFQAYQAGDTREEWHDFIYLLKRAQQQALRELNQKTLESLFLLGQVSGQLSSDTQDEDIRKLQKGDLARRRPLQERNTRKAMCKLYVQELAVIEWEKDSQESIRIGEMCHIVWSKVVESRLRGDLPSLPEGLKSWLKPVAPDFASKRGRPRKK